MTDTKSIGLETQLCIPDHVLFQTMDGSSALLNMDSEYYFGLDPIGTQIWQALERSDTLGEAVQSVQSQYDVSLETLTQDAIELVQSLIMAGLLDLKQPS